MHVIFGGAFNGKRAYVENLIQGRSVQWMNAEEDIPVLLSNTEVVVVYGVENLVQTKLEEWLEHLERWNMKFEVIVIATEIGRGIVPMEATARRLRDDVGRFYQQLFTKAESVTRIWYGIAQTIKGDVWR
ncbi:bifunctional adenosylcobinamide kinase/adenosylcobinamide-phosphate guanylyltransferase [Psychrobacillus sp. NEAU-3TGS]|uniref:bifunctional adenosylcobinamide kinase/adenosylcobinamide-phosphate guanylyltransferase n=1 Tax=Psychrobacillus sp. NEAU-3TGS TaxID=2995412 RepID=UPI002496E342|nr:bifunctional adenosylcobinamide kinase/adenosylcobinamide-phosphate guanylyltransferase [Psychrobacillus sp. NEAU-3TGS]MDI2587786.1 bifunctional adenosylcobinamide kinase/adenosylcobinamide-phosphate guanylyltransferase [Psychrobacillus sp. NEAU-3TGS]